MKFKDYYRILGVAPEATAEDIKIAYRKLARKYHPDVNKEPGAEKSFTEVGEANEVLKDPKRRAAYDTLRAEGWRDGQEIDAPPPAREFHRAGGFDAGEAAYFSDFFQSLFGAPSPGDGWHGGFGRSAFPERGDDIHYTLAIRLEAAYHGGEMQLQLQAPQLNDRGERVGSLRTITVKIPKGVVQGTRMRLRGQGQPGTRAELNGDLYLEIELAPHPLYRVAGRDLSVEVPITPWEAVLGAKIEVPTLGGTVTATIPAGTQDGQRLRLKGRGLPGDPPGDQYLTLNIVVPPSTNDKVNSLYRELAKESAFNPRAKLGV